MSGNICSYFQCGKSSRGDPSLRKFSFPVGQLERCQTWIRNSGNSALQELSSELLKKKFLCQAHFQEEDFSKRGLSKTAVPIKYSEIKTFSKKEYNNPNPFVEDVFPSTSGVVTKFTKSGELHIISPEKVRNTSPNKSTSTVSIDSDWNSDLFPLEQDQTLVYAKDTPRKKKLKVRLQVLKKKLKSKKSLLSQMKRNIGKDKKKVGRGFTPRDLNSLAPFARALVRMQLYHKPRMAFMKDEKKVAISLFYKSPSLYRFLRKNKVILPSESSVKMWISDFNAKAGFDRLLLQKIKQKVSTMTDLEKQCILMFDEMDIKSFLDYSRKLDVIEGFEDLGQFGRKPVLAKKVLVLMVRGLYSQWKLPLAYFFSETSVNAQNLKNIISKAVEKLEETSLKLLATVCDQSTTNQKLYKLLNISISNPYFYINEKKYYALYDVPHLIKSLRNNLLNGYFIYGNKIVSLEAIKKLFELDTQSSTGKAIPKITDKHLNPNTFERMNVKLAAQLFSHSTAAALRTAVRTKELHSSALDTADFVEQIDKLFDALNSQTLYAPKMCNAALSDSNLYALDALQQGFKLFTVLTKQNLTTGTLNRPPCFNGMLQTINAVNSIFRDSVENGLSFLLTRRLNQDPLENQFSLYRQSGGYNRNPTARTFKVAFKMSATINLIKPTHSNCEEDEDQSILEHFETYSDASSPSSSFSSQSSEDSVISLGTECSTLEKNAIVYFGGYLLKKTLDKYKCDLCEQFLGDDLNIATNTDEALLFFKNYTLEQPMRSLLKVPSPILKYFTEISMRYFSKHLTKLWTKKYLGKRLEKNIINQLKLLLPDWFLENDCKVHRQFILQLLIRTLLFKQCKIFVGSIKTNEKTKSSKRVRKLSILKHT